MKHASISLAPLREHNWALFLALAVVREHHHILLLTLATVQEHHHLLLLALTTVQVHHGVLVGVRAELRELGAMLLTALAGCWRVYTSLYTTAPYIFCDYTTFIPVRCTGLFC